MIRNDRNTTLKGGIIVYVKNTLKVSVRNEIMDDNIETIWIEIIKTKSKNRLLGFCYRPPSAKVSWYDMFEKQLEAARSTGLDVGILGDFNLDLIDNQPTRWLDIIKSYDMHQIVKGPTRITANTSTFLDHIYINNPKLVKECVVSDYSISDHFPTGMTLKWGKQNGSMSNLHKTITRRRNCGSSTQNLYNLVRDTITNIDITCDVNRNVDKFTRLLKYAIDKYMPTITKRIRIKNGVKWINNEIHAAIRKRDKLKKNRNFIEYKKIRNKIVKMVKSAKREYYKHVLKEA